MRRSSAICSRAALGLRNRSAIRRACKRSGVAHQSPALFPHWAQPSSLFALVQTSQLTQIYSRFTSTTTDVADGRQESDLEQITIVNGLIDYESFIPNDKDLGLQEYIAVIRKSSNWRRILIFCECRHFGHIPPEGTLNQAATSAHKRGRDDIAEALLEDALQLGIIKKPSVHLALQISAALGQPSKALQWIERAASLGIQPDAASLKEYLKACFSGSPETFDFGAVNAQIEMFASKFGVKANADVYSILVTAYLDAGKVAPEDFVLIISPQLNEANELYQQLSFRHFPFNIMLTAAFTRLHAMRKDGSEVNKLIKMLPDMIPNLANEPLKWRPWDTAIEGYIWSGQLNKLEGLIQALQRAGRPPLPPVLRKVVHLYLAKNRLDLAEQLVMDYRKDFFMTNRKQPDYPADAVLALCDYWLQHSQIDAALRLVTNSVNQSHFHAKFTRNVVDYLLAWGDDTRLRKVIDFLDIVSTKVRDDEYYEVLMRARIGGGSAGEATRLFDTMIELGLAPTVDHCNLVIQAHIRNKDASRATAMFQEMQTNGIAPNTTTFALLMRHHASKRSDAKVAELWQQMLDANIAPDSLTYTQLLFSKFSCAKWQEVVSTHEAMQIDGITPEPAGVLYIVQSLAMLRQIEPLIALVRSQKGAKPYYRTEHVDLCVAAALACAEHRRFDDVPEFIRFIVDMQPPVLTWAQVSKLVDKAIIRSLPPGSTESNKWRPFVRSSTTTLEPADMSAFLAAADTYCAAKTSQ